MTTRHRNGLAQLRRLTPEQRRLFGEAAVTLSLVSATLRLMPFRRAIGLGAVTVRQTAVPCSVAELVWAVEAAARRLPWRIVCIQKGIAAQRMLRRHGVDARLDYGVRGSGGGPLEAHVWVVVDGVAVIGGEEAPDFARVASYPSAEAVVQ